MLKAAAGGGGKGMRAVTTSVEMASAYDGARSEVTLPPRLQGYRNVAHGADSPQHFRAREARQGEIEHDQIRRMAGERFDCGRSVRRTEYVESLIEEILRDHVHERRLVVDDEDGSRRNRSHRVRGLGRTQELPLGSARHWHGIAHRRHPAKVSRGSALLVKRVRIQAPARSSNVRRDLRCSEA